MAHMPDEQRRRRPLRAFIIAPLAPGAVALAFALMSGKLGEGLWACMILVPISYMLMVFPGSVFYLVLRRLNWVSPWSCALLGALCAGTACIAIWWGTWAVRFTSGNGSIPAVLATFSMIAIMFGAPTGLVFWRLERPAMENSGTLRGQATEVMPPASTDVLELRRQLIELFDTQPQSKDELEPWYAKSQETAEFAISKSIGMHLPEIFWHWLADADIRSREPDSGYTHIQNTQMQELIGLLGTGYPPEGGWTVGDVPLPEE
jgi:hypothetical protein